MIIDTKVVETTGNMDTSRDVLMEIDQAAVHLVLQRLVDMYSDPKVAVLREITSNAIDSHVMAGQTRPVEVTLPSSLFPSLVVQDWGIGLSREELFAFGQFGSSTKREDNTQIGGFGLGSKSPLAVAAQFTVTAVKDGKRNTIIIGRREDGHPKMTPLDEQDTDEPNGVKVTVPLADVPEIETALKNNFFIGWKPGTITINNSSAHEPVSIHDPKAFVPFDNDLGWKLAPGQDFRQALGYINGSEQGIALVGPVKYIIDWSKIGNYDYTFRNNFLSRVVVNVPIGSVTLTPSREALIYDKKTIATLSQIIEDLQVVGKESLQSEVDAAKDRREAINVVRRLREYGFKDWTYRGEAFDFTVDKAVADERMTHADIADGIRSEWGAYRNVISYSSDVQRSLNSFMVPSDQTILVTDCEPMEMYRGRSLHKESLLALHFVLRETNKPHVKESPRAYNIKFTSLKADQLNVWYLAAHKRVLTREQFMASALKEKADQAQNAKVARAVKQVDLKLAEARVLVFRDGGQSIYVSKTIGDLVATDKHIVLHTGASHFGDKMRQAITTRNNYYDNKSLSEVMAYLTEKLGYKVLLFNKSVKVADLLPLIPNAEPDLKAVIAKEAAVAAKGRSELALMAMRDKDNGSFNWARQMPADFVKLIEDKKTREWVEFMSNHKQTPADMFLSLVLRNEKGMAEDIPALAKVAKKARNAIETASDAPGAAFRLLKDFYGGYRSDWDAVVEYINLVTKKNAAQAAKAKATGPVAPAGLVKSKP